MIYINPYLSVPINTIIGGVAGTISTKAALATKLGISESIITRFEIVGSDVHARISESYVIPTQAFLLNTEITSFIDLGGLVQSTGQQAFAGSSIINALLVNCSVGKLGFAEATNLTNALYNGDYNYNASTAIGTGEQFRNTRFKKFISPNLKIFPNGFLRENSELLEIIAQPEQLGSYAIASCSKLNLLDASKVHTIADRAIANCPMLTSLNMNSLINVTASNSLIHNTGIKTASFSNLETVSATAKVNMFLNWTSAELISMRKLKSFGGSSATTSTFTALKLSCVIEVHIALATSNAGAADAALAWAKANRAAIVKFYDDNGNYVSTL